ncbi:MAG: hypothetical protein E7184_01430 [Erysipelotrichaceae bacterium]|nr:hypothetical protein [Erysipelotrichaceae bacterium]
MLTKLQLKLGMFLAEGEIASGDNENANNLLNKIYELFFSGTVRILILTGLGLFAVIKGVMLGMGIVQAADDQQQRKEKINSLKYMVIGVVLVVVLYLSAGYIINLISDLGAESK